MASVHPSFASSKVASRTSIDEPKGSEVNPGNVVSNVMGNEIGPASAFEQMAATRAKTEQVLVQIFVNMGKSSCVRKCSEFNVINQRYVLNTKHSHINGLLPLKP